MHVHKKILGKLKYTDTKSWASKWHDFLAVDGSTVTYKIDITKSIPKSNYPGGIYDELEK